MQNPESGSPFLKYRLLAALIILVSGCSTDKAEGKRNAVPAAQVSPTLGSFFNGFSQTGLVLRDSVSGYLDQDSIRDMILIFENKPSLLPAGSDSVEKRQFVVLLGMGKGLFNQALLNDRVALCKTCGYRLGDPYLKTAAPKGGFSIEQAGSSSDLFWKRTTSFKYSPPLKSWVLDQDKTVSGPRHPDKTDKDLVPQFTVLKTEKDFGRIPLDSFDIYQIDDRYNSTDSSQVFPISFGNTPSYQPWNRARSGIWNVLDYCTDRVEQRYLYFVKSHGDAIESASEPESDLSVTYDLVKNGKDADTCEGFGFRNIPSIRRGEIKRAKRDSFSGAYYLEKDTASYAFVSDSDSTRSWMKHLVFKRGSVSPGDSSASASGDNSLNVLYAGDLNGDGFIDLVFEKTESTETYMLYLSKKETDGTISMTMAGQFTFTE
jgi:hypothetical protein